MRGGPEGAMEARKLEARAHLWILLRKFRAPPVGDFCGGAATSLIRFR